MRSEIHYTPINHGEAVSGQITVTTAGTAVVGTSVELNNGVWLAGLSGNTGSCYVGNDGADDVTATNGFELVKGGTPVLIHVRNLNELYFDAATNGDKVCWHAA